MAAGLFYYGSIYYDDNHRSTKVTTLLRLLAFVAIALLIVSGAEADNAPAPSCDTDMSVNLGIPAHCLIHIAPQIDRKATRCISHDDILANGLTAESMLDCGHGGNCMTPPPDCKADDVPPTGCLATDMSGHCVIPVSPEIERKATKAAALTCDPGWALLQYPDTPIKVCAREMRAPR
jgi:hypothetical protein